VVCVARQELEAKLAIKRNEMVAAQDRLKTVGKDGYLRLAAEVDTYKVGGGRLGAVCVVGGVLWG
jgi:hypothetical protein